MGAAEIATIGSAVIGAAGSTATAISAGKANKRGVAYAERENDLQRRFQIQMTDAQNAYMTPENQMKRLKAAGINPHYYFGNGNTQPQTSGVPSSGGGIQPNIKGVDYTGFAQVGQTILQGKLLQAQIDNINADTRKKNEETTGQTLSNGISLGTLQNQPTSIDLDNQAKEAGIGKTTQEIELTKAKVENEKQDLITKISTNEKIREEINLVISQKNYTEEQINNLLTSIALTRAKIVTESITQQNIKADTRLKESQSSYQREQAKTQSFIRSNLSSQTSYQNALTKNLPTQGQILEENRKKLNRENYIGDKYDLNKRENSYLQSKESLNIMKQTYRNLMKDEKFKELKIEEQEFINMQMGIDAMLTPVTKNPLNPNQTNTSTTTTRFDSQGNYGGHTVTRTRRR